MIIKNRTIFGMLKIIFSQLNSRRKSQIFILVLFMVFVGISEVLSIGAVLPFLGVLINPEIILDNKYIKDSPKILNYLNGHNIIAIVTIFFVACTIFSAIARIILAWLQTRISYIIGLDFSINMYDRILHQDYIFHIKKNSSYTISGITIKSTTIVSNAIQPVITIVSSSIMILMILTSLVLIDPFIALTALLGFVLIYLIIILLVKGTIKKNSKEISLHLSRSLKALQEGLNGIRDVLLDCNQAKYLSIFSSSEYPLRKAYANNYVLGVVPRYGIEAFGMVLIAVLAFIASESEGGVYKAIPVLGALALGAQRMLPLMQQIYTGWTSLKGGKDSIYDALEILSLKISNNIKNPIYKKINFKSSFSFQDVSFRYDSNSDWVLANINITIPKGAVVGVIGESGAGKSTLLDLIMGLLQPSTGKIVVDSSVIDQNNKASWYNQVSHVPQSIFLVDTTIEENIAFSEPGNIYKTTKLEYASSIAQLFEVINNMPDKYKALVGERGANLSGGQIQRIGIARAIYKDAELMVLDEATSALDENTEIKILQSLNKCKESRTIILATHRISTLKYCTHIITVRDKSAFIEEVNSLK
jgi:ATP-binding cassette subfamily B protein